MTLGNKASKYLSVSAVLALIAYGVNIRSKINLLMTIPVVGNILLGSHMRLYRRRGYGLSFGA